MLNRIKLLLLFATLFNSGVIMAQESTEVFESASYKRFREGKIRYEKYNEFNTQFQFKPIEGLEFEPIKNEIYYASSVIKVDDIYYMWYSKAMPNSKIVGPKAATDTSRAFHWDLCEVWYATSTDGYNWQEQSVAISRGKKGEYNHRSVFNPEILQANGKYYLCYQAAASIKDARWAKGYLTSGDFVPNVIGMAVADSPNGPWKSLDKPILEPAKEKDAWDAEVIHEPIFFVKGGKYYLYYKSDGRYPWEPNIEPGKFNQEHADMPIATGVAIADNPEGPYVRSKYNPVLMGGHGTMMWPYRNGICATMPEGAERNCILFSEDGINFYPVIQGLTNQPTGGGCFQEGAFADVDETPGLGMRWGICHNQYPQYHFERFECDLSLEHGDKVNASYQVIKEYMDSENGEYDPILNVK
ncbi:MAG: family 43 glycosylhydrolase [Rikenellaceae bacterium]